MSKEKYAAFDCDYDHRATLTAAKWPNHTNPLSMLDFLAGRSGAARRRQYLTRDACERKLRHLLIECCRSIWHISRDARTRRAVEIAERYVEGMATRHELSDAHASAKAVYSELRATTDKAGYCAALPATQVTLPQIWFDHCQYAVDVAAMAHAAASEDYDDVLARQLSKFADLLRDIFGDPFRSKPMQEFSSSDTNTQTIARETYVTRNFSDMARLADALESTGCTNAVVLDHCRGDFEHVRGCWVIGRILGHQ